MSSASRKTGFTPFPFQVLPIKARVAWLCPANGSHSPWPVLIPLKACFCPTDVFSTRTAVFTRKVSRQQRESRKPWKAVCENLRKVWIGSESVFAASCINLCFLGLGLKVSSPNAAGVGGQPLCQVLHGEARRALPSSKGKPVVSSQSVPPQLARPSPGRRRASWKQLGRWRGRSQVALHRKRAPWWGQDAGHGRIFTRSRTSLPQGISLPPPGSLGRAICVQQPLSGACSHAKTPTSLLSRGCKSSLLPWREGDFSILIYPDKRI